MNFNIDNIESDIFKKILLLLIIPAILIIAYYYITKNLYTCLSLLIIYFYALFKYVKNKLSKDINKPSNTQSMTSKREFGTKVYVKQPEQETKISNEEPINENKNINTEEHTSENPEPDLENREELIIEEFTSN